MKTANTTISIKTEKYYSGNTLSCLVSDGTGVKTHERKMESGLPVSGTQTSPLSPVQAETRTGYGDAGSAMFGRGHQPAQAGFLNARPHGPAGVFLKRGGSTVRALRLHRRGSPTPQNSPLPPLTPPSTTRELRGRGKTREALITHN